MTGSFWNKQPVCFKQVEATVAQELDLSCDMAYSYKQRSTRRSNITYFVIHIYICLFAMDIVAFKHLFTAGI
jgi:hypothetical protein